MDRAANFASPWAAPVALTVSLLCVLFLYGRGWYFLARERSGQVWAWRFVLFLAGLITIWIAWTAWLDALTRYLLIAHMVQHLLLMLIAPPLLLFGAPCRTLRRGLGRPGVRGANESKRSAGSAWPRRLGVWFTHPVVAGTLMVAVTLVWHIPAIFAIAMGSPLWHTIEKTTFLASGVLFWWPVILPWPSKRHWPRWTVPLYLLGFDMPVSVLSAYLAFCGYVVYPAYLATPRPFAISALNDQVAAAMLMWVAMLLVFLAAAVVVIMEVLEPTWGHSPETEDAEQAVGRNLWPSSGNAQKE